MAASACIAKIDEDLNGALPHWKKHFGTWVFVHNGLSGLGPEVTAHLLALDAKHKKKFRVTQWGFEEIRQKMFGLEEPDIASLLGPAPSRHVMMNLGLDDLAPVQDCVLRRPRPMRAL